MLENCISVDDGTDKHVFMPCPGIFLYSSMQTIPDFFKTVRVSCHEVEAP